MFAFPISDEIRPLDPIEFVAAYMLLNKGLYDENPMYEFSEDDPSDFIDHKLEIWARYK